MADLPDPISRSERQRQTREALVFAAREVFADVGYHAATLDQIAGRAGFSKGAVYSNFEGKAALFLAVMDANFELAFSEAWDPFQRVEDVSAETDGPLSPEEMTAAMAGFALATLEFIAMAARDESLADQLGQRMQRLMDAYTEIAGKSRTDHEQLPAEELGLLLAALDQGAGILLLSGGQSVDQRLLRVGVRRLLDPVRATEAVDDADGGPAIHDQVVQQRIATALRQGATDDSRVRR